MISLDLNFSNGYRLQKYMSEDSYVNYSSKYENEVSLLTD